MPDRWLSHRLGASTTDPGSIHYRRNSKNRPSLIKSRSSFSYSISGRTLACLRSNSAQTDRFAEIKTLTKQNTSPLAKQMAIWQRSPRQKNKLQTTARSLSFQENHFRFRFIDGRDRIRCVVFAPLISSHRNFVRRE